MNIILRSLRSAPGLVLAFSALIASTQAQVARFVAPAATSRLSVQGSFSDLAQGAATDPADAVCARSAVNSVVTDPPVLSSQNGVLEVSFQYQTAVDAAGLTRYCYVYTDSSGNTQEAPTLEVNPGDQLIIHFTNNLPAASASGAHSMPAMKMPMAASAADAACSATSVGSTSTNLHFHGTNVAPVCHQDEVIHTLIQPQEEFDYQVQIPANEPPGVYWYHPHPHGFSEAQVLGGASGAIIVEGVQNVNPVVAGLPQRVFVLRDQALPASETTQTGNPRPKTDISINYVPILYPSYAPAIVQTGPSEKEFWRVLNTSADTLLDIAVMDHGQPQPLQIVSVDGVPLTDGNGNPTTTTVTSYAMSPASRIEFIVTTPTVGDGTAQLVTQTWNNGAEGDADPGRPIANIVSSASSSQAAARRLPAQTRVQPLARFGGLDATTPVTQRTLYFSVNLALSPPQFYITLDGQTPAVFNMDGPPNIVVTEGTVEQWTIQNRSLMDHNFHIHQLHFQTLAVNGVAVSDNTRRDTIDIPHWSGVATDPYPSVTLMMDFRDPNIVGTFVYHCHILSHEDLGMMGMIQVLPGATTTTLSVSPGTTVSAGTSVTLTATVAPAAGSGTPTGTVTFQKGSTTLGTGTLNSSGMATLATTALPIGSNTVTAAYSGDSSFAASTSAGTAITVTPAATTTTLTASPTSILAGSSVAFTATVTATAGTGTAAGNVTFLNGSTTLGTAALSGSGVATLSTTSLPVGTLSITSAYAGNASFAPSTSAAVPVTVQPLPPDFGIAASPTTLSMAPGGTGTSTVTITPLNGFDNAVTFTCSGMPSEATCTFNPTSVTPNGTSTITATATISTTAASAMLHPATPRGSAPLYALAFPGLGALLGLGIFRKRLPRNVSALGMLAAALGVAAGIGACGGGSSAPSNPGTPAGTSTITFTATSGSTVHTAAITLTVSQ